MHLDLAVWLNLISTGTIVAALIRRPSSAAGKY
jgi:hypothetical protein